MPRPGADLAVLEARLGHSFATRAHLQEALTHVSSRRGGRNNQRLEFLGDRVLGLAAADLLMTAFPVSREGDLSRRISEVVRRETCAAVGQAWGLGPYLKVSGGSSGTIRTNPSAIADACEAVIGAVFLDGGFPAARDVVARGFADKLGEGSELPSNPKTLLQEWAAAKGRPPPIYTIMDRAGPDHAPSFTVAACVQGLPEARGEGPTRRAAEQAAAQAVLVREGVAPITAVREPEGAYA